MNTQSKGAGIVLDRSVAEAMLARVAVAAFTYYPGKSEDEPGYTVDEDVDWVMERAGGLDPALAGEWRRRIADVISSQDADHREFVASLMALAEE
ncbi:hypothetical protein [Microbacterium sp. 2FI]|uniref:hypothetical protein n=1 Tax=Microbacterium sp. 2FI TaxID=2502193 RepID=UPI0010F6AB15|nr:hypothetical protein [Microbacterium sp. 2FI]